MYLAQDGSPSAREWASSNPVTACWPSACVPTIRLLVSVLALLGPWTDPDLLFSLPLTIFPAMIRVTRISARPRGVYLEPLWAALHTRESTRARSNPAEIGRAACRESGGV